MESTHTKANLDTKTEFKEQLDGFYELIDKQKCVMLTTKNPDGSLISRPMHISSRVNGVDFYLFANKESQKVEDIQNYPEVNLSFYRDSDYSWVSVSGKASLVTDESKIKELYSPMLKAWFEDLGDGIHTGGPEDPRVILLQIETKDIIYQVQKNVISRTGQMLKGMVTGDKADMGSIRLIGGEQLEAARKLETSHQNA
ncbi:hypothetical protein K502DRAFT_311960 [Neoconidiobolus thromboides FSU 785]|nr:hypothetical protein K502DRAFT_311960 [Neoconidiobolus thromboides FSU 785]